MREGARLKRSELHALSGTIDIGPLDLLSPGGPPRGVKAEQKARGAPSAVGVARPFVDRLASGA